MHLFPHGRCQGEALYCESGEMLEEAAQIGSRCPIPGDVQGQASWGPGQPDLVLDLAVSKPAHSRGLDDL